MRSYPTANDRLEDSMPSG